MRPTPMLDEDAPWKQRFRAERIFAEIARFNPDRGMVAGNRTGLFQLYAWDVSSGQLSQLTERPAGTISGSISPDGAWVYYLDDQEGNELGHVVRVPFAGGAAQDLTPDLPPYTTTGMAMTTAGDLLGVTIPGPEGFECRVVALGDDGPAGGACLVHRSATLTNGPTFTRDGAMAVWTVAREGQLAFGLLAFSVHDGAQVAALWEEHDGSLGAGLFSPVPGDTRLLASSDRSGVTRPLVWDPATGERVDLRVDELEGGVAGWEWTPDARQILLCQTVRAAQQLWLYDLESHELTRLDHPAGTYSRPPALFNGDIALRWQDSVHPSQVIVLDGRTGRQKATLLAPAPVPPSRPWRSFTCTSSDGQEVQGWVATPEGPGPFPTILETHGGPTAAQLNVFSPSSQVWLDHGLAYCTVNYRGSTTFGRDFERKIWGDLGYWEVEDMVAARQWLVDEGIARPDAIFLTGWSYGGYLTLHALGTAPDLWAGGMGGVVVADWVSQYEDENEALRGYDVALFGGTLEEKREQYVKSSPITYLEQVRAPVMIIQGRNDTRDPPRQVELYEARARELNKPVEVIWFDTGHAGSGIDRELAIAHHERMLEFVYNVMGR